ncbi:plasmid pRiA4b ORF-3 family protein [Devosia sp. MC521]|uniref:plasmid pRiA4b ORF-3 family protein n=1 Tax=Devosia sp. MC521 TaxID=2759954 RepID=UPI0015FB8FD1|nr:plasmid pRiA4b ORF-3 family protein [Devosia sp. MC521]MBJ6989210.1 plasmid pRiA4b ORF-3 family protein [Devosia sp. MC521]QMW63292.1 plasmid pRiA4b ORF-3 family protein [Devosia sp. MC521]
MNSDRIARLHIQLDDVQPAIWRRVEVPLTSSLKTIHDVIQAVMLFEDYHLFQFEIGDRRYGYPDPEWGDEMRSARNARLGAILARGETRFTYTYDFGDDWRHSVVVEDVVVADPVVDYPRFIEGARRGPPEDVGGLPGFEEFLGATADPKHPEHASVMTWYGHPFDPTDIDLDAITARLAKLARRRAQGKAGFEKSRNRIN